MTGIKSGMRSKGKKAYPMARPRRIFGSLGVRGSLYTSWYTDNSCLTARAAVRSRLAKVTRAPLLDRRVTAVSLRRDSPTTRQFVQSLNLLALQSTRLGAA